jgi:hypothetical protein
MLEEEMEMESGSSHGWGWRLLSEDVTLWSPLFSIC